MVKVRIKKGDNVVVLRGKDRGKKGKVMAVSPREGTVLVEGIQLVTKHVKPKKAGQKAQRISVMSPLPIAKVQVICPACGKPTRTTQAESGRACKKCKASL